MEDKLTKTLRYSSLLSLYQNLLTDTQKEIMSSYFSYDLSLSEIAEERNISRAACEDAIKKGITKLEEYESKLNLYEKSDKILKITAKLKKNTTNPQDIADIEEIERNL